MRFVRGAVFCSVVLVAAPAVAQVDPNASLAQDLSSCAGAVAAFGDLNVVTYPNGASGQWADVLGRILARLNVEPGVEGMTGRYAASAARAFWREQSRSRQEAAANRCRERFAAQ
jgi:hypothetical protein